MAHDYRAIAERVYSAFERGDVTALPDLFASDYVEHEESPASTATGIELVAEWIESSANAFPDARYTIESVVGAGNEAVCRVRMTGTHRGAMFGIPATGNRIDVLLMDWVRLNDDGHIAEHWGTMQESKLMTQLGVPAQSTAIDLTSPVTTIP
jgi:steroid delta-isomerase-like uncharacterized protein